MKNLKKRSIVLIFFGLFSAIYQIHSQSSNNKSLYNWFDNTVGNQNLDIYNGPLHTNPYRTSGNSNMYFIADKFESGTLTYNNQTYFDVKLKYDIFRDVLIVNPPSQSEYTGINVNNYYVNSFSINNYNFIKVERKPEDLVEFTSGYYEEFILSPDFTFYIKHHKDMQKNVSESGLTYHFKDNNLFFIVLKGKSYLIKNKSDLLKIFQSQKKQINGFYLMNRELRNSDPNQFMKNLMKYINNSLTVQS